MSSSPSLFSDSQQHATQTVFVFPGQGSQKVGMLAELAEKYPTILSTFQEASDALGFDLWQIVQLGEHSGHQLDQTEFTQPALLTASIALWRVWLEQGGVLPKYMAGHSLGEYSALVAAEAMTLGDAVKLVNRRGQLMQQAVPPGQGSMAAILGLSDAQVIELCEASSQVGAGQVEAANFNAKGQVVIAGDAEAVQVAITNAKEMSGKAIVLPVSVPSHCRLMKGASEQFGEALNAVALKLPKIAVINNVNADVATDIDSLKRALVNQLYQPVQWTKTLDVFEQNGIHYLLECGSGNVLSNLAKRLPFVEKVFPTDTVARFDEALQQVNAIEV
ncbi:[acyl-carrier-protein] S-malonyltransferase [Acinetobacter marinus]|uniref:Malonyl CoA-acyl carrier protein transacylase n=1 Tax=Acinetobacter marinus TaxID=281375 RepID=A0A1G6NBI2_9GAMM|nr:ACP S-malonyltransferase [Acinetobacter marinus]SDC64754.1 [acyl-carrier-protein] S-malonyltransferase [Acinetobacter marinus]